MRAGDSVYPLGYILPSYSCTFFSLIFSSLVNRLTLFLFVRLGKWLIVLPSIYQIHTPAPAVPSLLSPARAGCIQMWLFGNALALVYSLNLPNHPGLHAYTIRQLFVVNIPKIWQYLFAFYIIMMQNY